MNAPLPRRIQTTLLDEHAARRWLALAVGVLLGAGLLAIGLVVARVPPLDGWLGAIFDPGFFKRCLVVHVDLALVVWFHAFLAALLSMTARRQRWARAGFALGAAGTAMICAAAFLPSAAPILANYVPVLDHPLFVAGLVVFGAGVCLTALSVDPHRPLGPLPPSVQVTVRYGALALLLAAATFGSSALNTPPGLAPTSRYELLMWGGGHALQLASVVTMVAGWLLLLWSLLGREVLSPRATRWILAALVGPWLAAPLLPLWGTETAIGRLGFTRLMQWAIFPMVCVILFVGLRALWRDRARIRLADHRVAALLTSAALTSTGFVLGAMISDSDTVIPGHYHASIGAVTVTLMGLSFTLMERLGAPLPGPRARRLAARQPLIFGVGQFVFAVGFALAGMPRKTYGSEQQARELTETVGLWVMGAGGVGAVAGGLLFLALVAAAVSARGARRGALTPHRGALR